METPIEFKVMADFSSSGIWDGKSGAMIEIGYLKAMGIKFTDDLVSKLKKWMNFLDKHEKEIIVKENQEYIEQLNKTGRSITKQIQELNPNYKFFYHSY